jgi:hypothetical protein
VRYKALYKELKADPSYENVLGMFNVNATVSKAENKADAKPDTTMQVTQNSREVDIYDSLRGDIESALLKFYNGGRGFVDVKKQILLSSPIMMLKEAKRIMNYYFVLGLKKATASDEDAKKALDTKAKDIVSDLVIDPISDLFRDVGSSSEALSKEDLNKLVLQNEQDPNFRYNMSNVFRAFIYTAVFAYPIYVKTSDKDGSFPLPQVLDYMPQRINVDKFSGDDKQFYSGVRNVFSKIYLTDYQAYINNAKVSSDVKTIIVELCKTLVPLFKELYFRTFVYLQGGAWFPFNHTYVTSGILKSFMEGGGNFLPNEYRIYITEIMYETIVKMVIGNFDIIGVKRGTLIDDISSSLVDTKINVVQYQNYIINTMITDNPAIQDYVDDIVELLGQIQKAVAIKKQVQTNLNLANASKFNEQDEFNELIDNLSFQEMYTGFEAEYFRDVVYSFYTNISESVNLKTANMRNIYYQRQKNFTVWKIVVIMLIIIMVLIYSRIMLSALDEKKKIRYVPPERDCDRFYSERDYKNRKTNWYIKLLLPLFVMIFLIAMLISKTCLMISYGN